MYNRGKILAGLAIFVLLALSPFAYNKFTKIFMKSGPPELDLPTQATNCVLPAAEMRAKHMQLLNTWRDEVVRNGQAEPLQIDGKTYQKSLQLGCMQCHTSKVNFCDKCHDYSSVKPYCWDCHLAPVE